MAQQTAVDYIAKIAIELGYVDAGLYERAKELEKEQIKKAFSDGQETPINHPTLPHYSSQEYYNDTFEK